MNPATTLHTAETASPAIPSDEPADPYPSRVAAQPRVIARQDPVLWGGAGNPGPLSQTQLESFAENGFVVVEKLVDDDALAELQATAAAAERDPDIRSATRITELGDQRVRSIFAVAEQSPVIGAFAAAAGVAGIARQILADDVYIHQSRINYKPGFEGREFFWHSDFETWHIEDGMPRMRALSMSLMLDDNTAANGPLMLIRGSHRHYVQCVGATPENHHEQSLRKQEYGVPDGDSLKRLADDGGITCVVAPAGSVVIFDCNTMHGSAGNISPYPRSNVFLVFNSLENRCIAPFGGMPPRPEHIGHRQHVAAL